MDTTLILRPNSTDLEFDLFCARFFFLNTNKNLENGFELSNGKNITITREKYDEEIHKAYGDISGSN